MRKRIAGKKLSRTSNERKQLFKNLIRSLADSGSIVTTYAKAKAVQPNLEKLVTRAKDQNLNSFRTLLQKTGDARVAKRLLLIGDQFKSRPGGYTQIVKLGQRQGDNAEMVKLAFVEKIPPVEAKVKAEIVKKNQGDAPLKTLKKTKEKAHTKGKNNTDTKTT